MEDDSPGQREEGRSFWGGLQGLIFGGSGEATLRDQIEEAIENREGEDLRRGDLSHVEREMLLNILHFGEKTAGDVAVPRGDIYAVPADDQLRGIDRRLRRGRPQPHAGLRGQPRHGDRHDPRQGRLRHADQWRAVPGRHTRTDAHAALRARKHGRARSARADARRAHPSRHRRRRIRRHRGPGHDRGRRRGDRRRDRGRA